MASTLTARVGLTLAATLENDLSVVTASAPISLNKSLPFTNGTAINQADRLYSARHSIASGTPLALDLAGTLENPLGETVTFAKVLGIIVVNNSTTAAEILTVGAGSNPISTWVAASGDGVQVGPNGFMANVNPSLAGFAVTGGTADILTITSASGTISTDIYILGRSA
jgi:hypothetical protein